MSGETMIPLIGNLTADPELRFTPSGAAVCEFTVASTPRTFDKRSNEWVDGETLFLRCSVWREAAENCAESLRKGMRVIVYGKLKSRTFETKSGEKRTVTEVDVDEVGPSLRYASADVKRQAGASGAQQSGARSNSGRSGSDYRSGTRSAQNGAQRSEPEFASPQFGTGFDNGQTFDGFGTWDTAPTDTGGTYSR